MTCFLFSIRKIFEENLSIWDCPLGCFLCFPQVGVTGWTPEFLKKKGEWSNEGVQYWSLMTSGSHNYLIFPCEAKGVYIQLPTLSANIRELMSLAQLFLKQTLCGTICLLYTSYLELREKGEPLSKIALVRIRSI